MQQRHVYVTIPLGIHARVSAKIVLLASKFKSSVSLAFNGRTANASSIVEVMLLAAKVGSTIIIETSGPDEREAIEALIRLIGNRIRPAEAPVEPDNGPQGQRYLPHEHHDRHRFP